MVTLRRRRIKRKRSTMRRRIIFIAIVAIFGILVANIVQSSYRPDDPVIVMSATAASQENISVKAGMAQLVEASEKTIANLTEFAPPDQFQGKIVRDIQPNSEEKVIALTFDDGPWGETTLQVLEILKKNNIKATFFWIGKHLEIYPEIARQVVAEGHAIANHTWSHRYHRFPASAAAKEIEDTAALIYKTTGVKTALFRPPGGVLNNGLAAYAQKNKYAVMMWSVNAGDSYSRPVPAPTLVKNVLKGAKSGGIVLMHDGGGNRATTVEALPQIIDKLTKDGYKFVTLPELLELANG